MALIPSIVGAVIVIAVVSFFFGRDKQYIKKRTIIVSGYNSPFNYL